MVPSDWLDRSFTPRVPARGRMDFGFHWWLGEPRNSGRRWIGAFGNGGQSLFIVSSLEIVVVTTAGNYNLPGDGELPFAVMSKVIVPSFRDQ